MKKLKLLSSVLLALITCGTIAGESTGTISKIFIAKENSTVGSTSGAVMFSAGPHTNKPACSNVGDDWAIPLETEAGRAMYSLLLTASTTGKSIHVSGTGSCGGWPDREEPNSIQIIY